MITFRQIRTNDPNYAFVEDLLHESFPIEERRDDEQQRHYTDYNERFRCYLITDETENGSSPIGLITIWDLNAFRYIEHLATAPQQRNKGYGKAIMNHLESLYPDNIIILEVERPTNEISTRRIGFYERCGFRLCTKNYIQPSYHNDGQELPLYLMFKGTENIDKTFELFRDEIHRNVYGIQK